MVVTIPVEGGYRGGQINVEHRQQKKSFHFEKESSQRFSLVTFYTDCRHELERVTSGAMVAMVFHINWLDALEATTSPLEFPAFFKTFYEVSDILIPWTYSQSPDENAQVSLGILIFLILNLIRMRIETILCIFQRRNFLANWTNRKVQTEKLYFYSHWMKSTATLNCPFHNFGGVTSGWPVFSSP